MEGPIVLCSSPDQQSTPQFFTVCKHSAVSSRASAKTAYKILFASWKPCWLDTSVYTQPCREALNVPAVCWGLGVTYRYTLCLPCAGVWASLTGTLCACRVQGFGRHLQVHSVLLQRLDMSEMGIWKVGTRFPYGLFSHGIDFCPPLTESPAKMQH